VKAEAYIKSKQKNFALNKHIELRSRKMNKGAKLYTAELNDNLFKHLPDEVEKQFNQADGNELTISCNGDLPKIQAVHSSSALVVNIFSYWLENPGAIAVACKLSSPKNKHILTMRFEAKIPIREDFKRTPNIDVLFEVQGNKKFQAFAVESKFLEPFSGRTNKSLNPVYLNDGELWVGLPNLRKLGTLLSSGNQEFRYLDAVQLIKHVLCLNRAYKKRFKLLYLYYQVQCEEDTNHLAEINKFNTILEKDQVEFRWLSYQKLIDNLANKHRVNHQEYIRYITTRYF